MEPSDWERFDSIRYWFAFYGSHTKEADNKLTMDLITVWPLLWGMRWALSTEVARG